VTGPRARELRAGRGLGLRALLLFGLLALWAANPPAAHAQGLGLNAKSDEPIEINADQGIEWRQKEKIYVARGNASAKRGDVTLRADTLTAHYRPTKEGGTDIWRLDAVGHVDIASSSATATGDTGVYDVPTGVLVLRGRDLKLVAQTFTVTARDSLEYYDAKRMAVARGDAEVTSEDKRLKADIVSAFFRDAAAANGKAAAKTKTAAKSGAAKPDAAKAGAAKEVPSQLQRIEAFDHVRVSSPGQVALGDRGVYDVESGIAMLYGSVKITRGDNQLNGAYGEVNLNTGVSRLLSGPPGTGGAGPVRGLFSPKKKPEIAPRDRAGADPSP
jgi:lipopolysaccharide export system protein LptA